MKEYYKMDDNKTVRVTVQPEVSKDLSNATKLKTMMRAELRRVQNTKLDSITHKPGDRE